MTDESGPGPTVANGGPEPEGARIQSSGRMAFSSSLWRIAALTTAAAIGGASSAEAAVYWSDSDYGLSRARSTEPMHSQRVRRSSGKKIEAPLKESAKPKGPLVIAVSIDKQKVKIYDANGVFAEAPISTGMRGHPTPMGVFSVIEKDRYHHSNIYSGAPMPYMQRITWSGVAMHAGVLPGYPASHGCIRMPMDFAVKMWGWTRMGARVVVTPGEISPVEFSHPLLATKRVVPQPVAAVVGPADSASAASLNPLDSDEAIKPTIGQRLELRSSIGHDDGAKPAQTRTADARGAMSEVSAPVTMSDATLSSDAAQTAPKTSSESLPREETAAGPGGTAVATDDVAVRAGEASRGAKPDASDKTESKPDAMRVPTEAISGTVGAEAAAGENVQADETKVDAKADTSTAVEKPDAAAVTTNISPSVPDVTKDQGRLPDTDKPAAEKPIPALALSTRAGQIAVFISRKDSRLYVRQNFKPLFDVPVTIAASDRPLGTHVFTAQVDKEDANLLHWSVVSLPAPARYAARDEDEPRSRKRKAVVAAEPKAGPLPDSPAEALDRLTLPADVMARIYEVFSTGASIIVSDQGIRAGETGEGTDFIVSLR